MYNLQDSVSVKLRREESNAPGASVVMPSGQESRGEATKTKETTTSQKEEKSASLTSVATNKRSSQERRRQGEDLGRQTGACSPDYCGSWYPEWR
jgi:hypothetical protein